jgi:hypothetical protein
MAMLMARTLGMLLALRLASWMVRPWVRPREQASEKGLVQMLAVLKATLLGQKLGD